MPKTPTHTCPHAAAVETLARDALLAEDRLVEQRHLEECEPCIALFHQRTAVNFPTIPQYTILERVGEGGFGIVYKAVHHQKRRAEALKVLFGETKQRAAYFENEVHLVARLKHDTIATLYEAHLGTSPAYYSMEFVEGRRLDEHLAEGRPTLAERIRIVRDVAHAIGYAHEQGVVHRDIKPQNILIDLGGRPRIVDFGIGRRLGLPERPAPDSEQSPEGPIGTFGYMAPEQSEGKRVDARADVYSLGALLYFTVTGDPPRRMRPSDNLSLQFTARGIPRATELAAIIRRCLEFAPERRYAGCVELVADLDSFLIGWPSSVVAGRSSLYRARRVTEFFLRRHTPAARIAVTLFAVLLLTALHWGAGARVIVAADRNSTVLPMRAAGAIDPGAHASRPEIAGEVTLVAYTGSTEEQLRSGLIAGFDAASARDRTTRRRLHAALLDKLAAWRPRVVVFDHYYRECMPDVDEKFIAAIRAAGAPVVVGAARFDVNTRPEICPHVAEAVHAWGALVSANPGDLTDELAVLAIQRGFEPPVPSLAIAALAAWRHPDAALSLALEPEARRLHIRYRRHTETPGQSRWLAESDTIPLISVGRFRGSEAVSARDAGEGQPIDAALAAHATAPNSSRDGDGALRESDVVARARFPMPRNVRGDGSQVAVDKSPPVAAESDLADQEVGSKSVAIENDRPAPGEPTAIRGIQTPIVEAPLRQPRSEPLILPLEVALAATDAQAAAWFSNRAVVVGQMAGLADRHELRDGTYVYGVEIQAQILRSLLLGQTPATLSRAEILVRLAGWSVLAAIIASFAARVGRVSGQAHESVRPKRGEAPDARSVNAVGAHPSAGTDIAAARSIDADIRIPARTSTLRSSQINLTTVAASGQSANSANSSRNPSSSSASPSVSRSQERGPFAEHRRAVAAPAAIAGIALILSLGGLLISGYAAMYITTRWSLEAALAAGAILAAGGFNLLITAVRSRQERLSPDLIYPHAIAAENVATIVRAR